MEKSPALMQQRGPEGEEDEPMDFAHVPFDDEEEEEDQPAVHPNDDSLLQLSASGAADISGLASPGLDDSREESSLKRAAESAVKRKRRKRRKVVIDNDNTELTNEHIKSMLADTSDIVKRMRHPADVDDDEDEAEKANKVAFVPIVTRPFMADDGHLHPQLVALWQDSFHRALDRPCPYERQENTEDVEHARQAAQDDEEASKTSDLMDQGPVPNLNDEEEEEEPDDFAPPPMDDEEEEEDPINPPMDSDSEQEENLIGDLGLVNELQLAEDEEEEDREAVGEHTGTKWHKHTVKVLKLLQNRMRPQDQEDEEGEEKPAALEFGDLAKNVNRRTAASCFIECLVRSRRGWKLQALCV